MKINKDTILYGSFSKEAGNKGCEFFNQAFEKYNINAIYKSFSIDNIANACIAAETLKMGGFAVAMPYKLQVSAYINKNVSNTPSVNTVVRKEKQISIELIEPKKEGELPRVNVSKTSYLPKYELIGYNTDYIGAKQIIEKKKVKLIQFSDPLSHIYFERIYIIGKGGLSISVQQASKDLGLEVIVITRENGGILKDLKGCLIYNCTPLDVTFLAKNNKFIDCRIGTPDGDELHKLQSRAQFKLYTGIEYKD